VAATWKARARLARDRTTLVGDIVRTVAIDPRHGVSDAYEHLRRTFERPAPPVVAMPSPAWEQRLHELLGCAWPCACLAELEPVWQDIGARLADAGLRAGRGAYDGWDDGDRALARAAWCVTRHARPQRVVETGVGRGIVTRTILEALAHNRTGRLWSIDMPLLLRPELANELAVAVPAELRPGWTLIRGASRRRLPGLLAELGPIDLFVHDSLHTERNMRFELKRSWPQLRPRGVAIVDDVHCNAAFHDWRQLTHDAAAMVCVTDDERAQFGLAVKAPTAAGRFAAADQPAVDTPTGA